MPLAWRWFTGLGFDAIEITRSIGGFFHTDVRSDAAFIEPLQKLTVAVGVICRQCLRELTVSFAISFYHVPRRCTLLTQSRHSCLHTYDDATPLIHKVVVIVTYSW